MSGVYADVHGRRRRRGHQDGDRRLRRHGARQEDHAADAPTTRTSPTSAPSKFREWADQNGLNMLIGGSNTGVNIAMAKVAAAKKVPLFAIGAGGASLTNEDCTRLHGALRLRHRRRSPTAPATRHRQGRRQDLVLPDRRLRLRHAAAGRRLQGRRGQRRQDRRRGARAAGGAPTSRRSCCRRRARGRRCWAWPTPAPTSSTRSRPPTSSASPRR